MNRLYSEVKFCCNSKLGCIIRHARKRNEAKSMDLTAKPSLKKTTSYFLRTHPKDI